jgi:hypothetical protein
MILIKSPKQMLRRVTSMTLLSVLLISSSIFSSGRAVAFALQSELSAAEKEIAANIKSETIREVVTALSADDMLGRGTAQPGGDKAAQFLADRFAKVRAGVAGMDRDVPVQSRTRHKC